MKQRTLFVIVALLQTLALHSQDVFTAVKADFQFAKVIKVNPDGSGDFTTVQAAVDAAPDFLHNYWTRIEIAPGTYKERIIIPTTKYRLYICGSGAENTILTYDNYAEKLIPGTQIKTGTSGSASMYVLSSEVIFEDLTIANTAGEGKTIGQAVAIQTAGDHLVFRRCRFIGNQDTVYTYGHCNAKGVFCRNLFVDCYIEGTTDFIFGPTTCWFENCRIHSKKNSYITAASTYPEQDFGYVFHKCTLTAEPGIDKVYLGRPWRPFAKTVFLECELGGHITAEGWHNWKRPDGKTGEDTSFYGEWGNVGAGASLSGRVSWMHKLTDEQAAIYSFENVMAQAGSAGPGL